MKDLFILLGHLLTTIARLLRSGGAAGFSTGPILVAREGRGPIFGHHGNEE